MYSFNEVLRHIDLNRYFVAERDYKTGRPPYDGEKLLKVILFAFMEEGFVSTRRMQKLCKTDIRFIWLLDGEEAPSHTTINNFINQQLKGCVEEIFLEINRYIFKK